MSSPTCADGYDTPEQKREDTTTFMASGGVGLDPIPSRALPPPPLRPGVSGPFTLGPATRPMIAVTVMAGSTVS